MRKNEFLSMSFKYFTFICLPNKWHHQWTTFNFTSKRLARGLSHFLVERSLHKCTQYEDDEHCVKCERVHLVNDITTQSVWKDHLMRSSLILSPTQVGSFLHQDRFFTFDSWSQHKPHSLFVCLVSLFTYYMNNLRNV